MKLPVFAKKHLIFPVWFWCVLLILLLIKLWIVDVPKFSAMASSHDDMLFLKLAESITHGQWLGEHNSRTLIKVPFYPIWIAVMWLLHIPLGLSHQLLYWLACLTIIVALRKRLSDWPFVLLGIYTLFLFHPISYNLGELGRVIRENIYISLTLLVFGLALGLLLRKRDSLWVVGSWGTAFGIVLGLLIITREEAIWIYPSVLLLGGALFLPLLLTRQWKNQLQRIGLLALTCILLPCLIVQSIAVINKISYGVYITSEQTNGAYLKAYGALLRIKPKEFQPYVPVPKETRSRIYKVSPTFKKIQKQLEGKQIARYKTYGPLPGDDFTTHFNWAFHEAVSRAGYYDSAEEAEQFYEQLAAEVNAAADSGLLDAYGPHDSLRPILRRDYLKPTMRYLKQGASDVFFLEGSFVDIPQSRGELKYITLFQQMTRDTIGYGPANPATPEQTAALEWRSKYVLNPLLKLYRIISPLIVILGTLAYFSQIGLSIRHKTITPWVVFSSSILVAIAARLTILALIDATAWPDAGLSVLYQSPIYPLMILFSALSLISLLILEKKTN